MKKILFILIFLITTSLCFADLEYEMVSYSSGNTGGNTPLFNINMFNSPKFTINYASFAGGFQSLFDLIIGISIATAVIVFMYSAFQGIINANNASDKKKADEGMRNAVIGLMIILSTWLIINTVNPDLLRLPIFSGLGGLQAAQSPAQQQNVTGGAY